MAWATNELPRGLPLPLPLQYLEQAWRCFGMPHSPLSNPWCLSEEALTLTTHDVQWCGWLVHVHGHDGCTKVPEQPGAEGGVLFNVSILNRSDLFRPDLFRSDLGRSDLGRPDLGRPDLFRSDLNQNTTHPAVIWWVVSGQRASTQTPML